MFKVDIQTKKSNRVVEIVDSCMGTSKTTNILKWIDSKPNTKFIFVSPLLSEVQEGGRIHRDLNSVVLDVPIQLSTISTTLFNFLVCISTLNILTPCCGSFTSRKLKIHKQNQTLKTNFLCKN